MAVAIAFAFPAAGQPAANPTNSNQSSGRVVGQTPPEAQPATTSAQAPPAATSAPAPVPAVNSPSATGPATTGSAEAESATSASDERPTIAKGIRRTADGRLAFSDSRPAAVELPGGAKRRVRSLLNVTKPLSYGEYVWDDKGASKGRIWVLVDPAHQLISVFRGRDEIGTAVTLYGADEFPTPTGSFRIQGRTKDHRSRKYDNAPMPYTLWLTKDGVAIHGNNVLEGYASHGCVGVPLEFARHLFSQAKVGDEVFILRYKQAKLTQK